MTASSSRLRLNCVYISAERVSLLPILPVKQHTRTQVDDIREYPATRVPTVATATLYLFQRGVLATISERANPTTGIYLVYTWCSTSYSVCGGGVSCFLLLAGERPEDRHPYTNLALLYLRLMADRWLRLNSEEGRVLRCIQRHQHSPHLHPLPQPMSVQSASSAQGLRCFYGKTQTVCCG